jgi:hypothetical protein
MLEDQVPGKVVRWYAQAFLVDRLALYSGRSLTQNVGMDGSGIQSGVTSVYDIEVTSDPLVVVPVPVAEKHNARESIASFFREAGTSAGLRKRIRQKVGGLMRRTLRRHRPA